MWRKNYGILLFCPHAVPTLTQVRVVPCIALKLRTDKLKGGLGSVICTDRGIIRYNQYKGKCLRASQLKSTIELVELILPIGVHHLADVEIVVSRIYVYKELSGANSYTVKVAADPKVGAVEYSVRSPFPLVLVQKKENDITRHIQNLISPIAKVCISSPSKDEMLKKIKSTLEKYNIESTLLEKGKINEKLEVFLDELIESYCVVSTLPEVPTDQLVILDEAKVDISSGLLYFYIYSQIDNELVVNIKVQQSTSEYTKSLITTLIKGLNRIYVPLEGFSISDPHINIHIEQVNGGNSEHLLSKVITRVSPFISSHDSIYLGRNSYTDESCKDQVILIKSSKKDTEDHKSNKHKEIPVRSFTCSLGNQTITIYEAAKLMPCKKYCPEVLFTDNYIVAYDEGNLFVFDHDLSHIQTIDIPREYIKGDWLLTCCNNIYFTADYYKDDEKYLHIISINLDSQNLEKYSIPYFFLKKFGIKSTSFIKAAVLLNKGIVIIPSREDTVLYWDLKTLEFMEVIGKDIVNSIKEKSLYDIKIINNKVFLTYAQGIYSDITIIELTENEGTLSSKLLTSVPCKGFRNVDVVDNLIMVTCENALFIVRGNKIVREVSIPWRYVYRSVFFHSQRSKSKKVAIFTPNGVLIYNLEGSPTLVEIPLRGIHYHSFENLYATDERIFILYKDEYKDDYVNLMVAKYEIITI